MVVDAAGKGGDFVGQLTEEGATVRLRDGAYGRHSIQYAFTPAHWEAFRASTREMVKLQFAAGAREVRSLHLEPVVMKSVNELGKLDDAIALFRCWFDPGTRATITDAAEWERMTL
jgi:hypothetical protein